MTAFGKRNKHPLLKNRGFTLVELQVALLLVAMIAVLMAGALRLGAQTWHKVIDKQDIAEHRFLIAQLLRRQLNNMRFVRVRTKDGQLMSSFLGDQKQMHFIAPFPTFKNDNELYWWTLASEKNDETGLYQLVFKYRPYSAEQLVDVQADGSLRLEGQEQDEEGVIEKFEEVTPETLVIAENVIIEEAEYYSRDDQGVEEWLDEWPPLRQAPLVIRLVIAVVDEEDSEFPLPEIAVAPRYANQELYEAVDE